MLYFPSTINPSNGSHDGSAYPSHFVRNRILLPNTAYDIIDSTIYNFGRILYDPRIKRVKWVKSLRLIRPSAVILSSREKRIDISVLSSSSLIELMWMRYLLLLVIKKLIESIFFFLVFPQLLAYMFSINNFYWI